MKTTNEKPFDGKVIIFGSDFRQIPSIIELVFEFKMSIPF